MSRKYDDEIQEVERRQRQRIGKSVESYMSDDDDFENVDYYQEPDPYDINIKVDNNFDDRDIDVPIFDDFFDEDPYFESFEELAADDSITEEERARIHRRLASGKRIHKNIMVATYVFVALFIGMIVYLGYFTYTLRDDYLSNEYNLIRQGIYADRYIRGDIYSADGELLATTKTSGDSETRVYPYANLFAHAIGYSTKGTTGVESMANSYLLGSHTNILEQAEKEINKEKIQGDTVVTTLNTKLQQAAYDALGKNKGAVIVSEVKTGKILAMVSKPDYDPNQINEIWDELVSDATNSNLVNRASQGLYPPGSTFKILTALEYIRENPGTYTNFTYDCSGSFSYDGFSIRCYGGEAHGTVDFFSAFAQSCNGAFAKMGLTLDADKLHELCEKAGYNSEIDTDILSAVSSFKLTSDNATSWETVQASIGQSNTTVTPLLNLMIVSAIANNGTVMKPYMIDYVKSAAGEVVTTFSSESQGKFMTTSEAQTLASMMRKVVTEGTGSALLTDSYSVAGKTGSAEWSTDKETHAWFVGYAPYEDPQIAISVVVEEGGAGGKVAAPIARKVFDAYFE